MLIIHLLPLLILFLLGPVNFFQAVDGYGEDQRGEYRKGDFESLNNAVYDVSASRYNRAILNQPSYSNGGQQYTSKYPKPKRISIKVEDASSSFMQCGGFSSGTSGTCCSACFQLNYHRGCYCRSWDCLCFDS